MVYMLQCRKMVTLKRNKYMNNEEQPISMINITYGFLAGVAVSIILVTAFSSKEKESRTILRMTLEDGKRIHLPLSRADESLIDRNGGEIKIKSLEFRKKE